MLSADRDCLPSSPGLSVQWLEQVNRHALAVALMRATVHDVANALQVMMGAAELLALDASGAAVEKRTSSIVEQAMHATRVLSALSAFVKAPPMAPVPVDLRQLAERVVAMRGHALGALRIEATVEGESAPCVADSRCLMQVALNLCVNAERALTGVTGPVMRWSAASGGRTASLRVSDSGAGVPAEHRARLFDWPQTLSPSGERLGIGLAVSHAMLARFGGSLAYEPGPDGGAVFTLTVPSRPG